MIDLRYKLLKETQEIPYELLLPADKTGQANDKYVHQSEVYLVFEIGLRVDTFCP